jgi:DNA-binding transcriptional LysR family regulator
MQFEALKVFCDVVRHGSFSAAALDNDLSQSAVSQIISQLEKRLGVQLIRRFPRPLEATSLGREYYEGCQGLVEQYSELEASIRQAQAKLAMDVRVAAIYSVGLGDMGQLIERFAEHQPGSHVHIDYLHPDRVYEKVLDGTADFGLVSFPRKSRDLIVLPWRQEEMVLVCAPRHPLAKQHSVKPAQLAGEKYVGFEKGLVIRRQVDRFLREQQVAVDVTLEFDNIENIKEAIEISAGVALLPEPTLRREVKTGTLVAIRLHGCRFYRPLGIIHRRHRKLSATSLGFIELLQRDNKVTR